MWNLIRTYVSNDRIDMKNRRNEVELLIGIFHFEIKII